MYWHLPPWLELENLYFLWVYGIYPEKVLQNNFFILYIFYFVCFSPILPVDYLIKIDQLAVIWLETICPLTFTNKIITRRGRWDAKLRFVCFLFIPLTLLHFLKWKKLCICTLTQGDTYIRPGSHAADIWTKTENLQFIKRKIAVLYRKLQSYILFANALEFVNNIFYIRLSMFWQNSS